MSARAPKLLFFAALAAGLLVWLTHRETAVPPSGGPPAAPAVVPGARVVLPAEHVDPQGRMRLSTPEGWAVRWLDPQPGETQVLEVDAPGGAVVVRGFHSRIPALSTLELFTHAVQLATRRGEHVIDGHRAEVPGGSVVDVVARTEDDTRRTRTWFLQQKGRLLQLRIEGDKAPYEALSATLDAVVESLAVP